MLLRIYDWIFKCFKVHTLYRSIKDLHACVFTGSVFTVGVPVYRAYVHIYAHACAPLAWANWRSATDDSVSQDTVQQMQLQSSRHAALRVCPIAYSYSLKTHVEYAVVRDWHVE